MDWSLQKDLCDEIKKQDQSDNYILKHMLYIYPEKYPPHYYLVNKSHILGCLLN